MRADDTARSSCRLAPFIDDRHVPALFPNDLRSRLHFFRVFRHHLTLLLLNLTIEVGQPSLVGIQLSLELTLFLLLRAVRSASRLGSPVATLLVLDRRH